MIYDLQKASILKRISAFLLDFILVCILATGFIFLISAIVDFDGKLKQVQELETKIYKDYNLDEYFKVLQTEGDQTESDDKTKKEYHSILLTEEEYNKLSEEGKLAHDNAHKEFFEQSAHLKVAKGSGVNVYGAYMLLFNLVFMMVSLGLFFAILITEFVMPLILKHGRTVGKRVFGVGVMLINGVKISNVALFVRAMLGKYAIETMVPVALIIWFFMTPNGAFLLVIVALLLLQLILIIATKNNSLIHDILSSTVTVDMATQMIFNSYDDLLKYKEQVHEDAVNNQKS